MQKCAYGSTKVACLGKNLKKISNFQDQKFSFNSKNDLFRQKFRGFFRFWPRIFKLWVHFFCYMKKSTKFFTDCMTHGFFCRKMFFSRKFSFNRWKNLTEFCEKRLKITLSLVFSMHSYKICVGETFCSQPGVLSQLSLFLYTVSLHITVFCNIRTDPFVGFPWPQGCT